MYFYYMDFRNTRCEFIVSLLLLLRILDDLYNDETLPRLSVLHVAF